MLKYISQSSEINGLCSAVYCIYCRIDNDTLIPPNELYERDVMYKLLVL